MPNPVTASPAGTTPQNIPGGDIPFDELFGSDPEVSFTANNSQVEPPQAPPTQQQAQEPQAPPPPRPQFRLETPTGTVYESEDAAVKGITEKDTLIRTLREQYISATGVDPLARKPVAPPPPPEPSYMQDAKAFADELSSAAQKGDTVRYRNAIAKLNREIVQEVIGPYQPVLQEYSRQAAQAQVAQKVKEWDQFRQSDDYNRTLDSFPALRTAIQASEQDVRYASQLGELYQLAYAGHMLAKFPELLQAAQAQRPAAAPPQQVRPPVSSQTLSPAAPVTQTSDNEMLKTPEGRAELKRRFEAMGLQNQDWSTVRWGG